MRGVPFWLCIISVGCWCAAEDRAAFIRSGGMRSQVRIAASTGRTAIQVAAGHSYYTCALLGDGSVKC
jgi:hypothetical protein